MPVVELNSTSPGSTFTPKPDITVYELATIIQMIGLGFTEEIYENMPPEIQRHFQPNVLLNRSR